MQNSLLRRIAARNPVIDARAPEPGREVQQGWVCEFDGVDDYIDLGDKDAYSFGDGATDSPFSISAWVKLDSTSSQSQPILSKARTHGVSADIEYALIVMSTGVVRLTLYDNTFDTSKPVTIAGNTVLSPDTWYHVAVTYDGSGSHTGGTFYLNGVDDTDTVGSSTHVNYVAMHNTTEELLVGVFLPASGTYTSYLDGSIAHVGLFDSELTSEQVSALYAGGYVEAVVWLNLNHKSGTIAYDSSGNGNHGTLMGGAAFAVDNTLPPEADKLNLEGYTVGTGSNGADAGVLIPRDESDPTKDVLGNDLQYSGSVFPVPPKKRDSYCAVFDGVDDYLSAPHLTGTETVVSHGGTSTPTVSAGRIDFTAGTCWDLVLSNGSRYPMAEGRFEYMHEVSGGGNHCEIMGASTTPRGTGLWAGRQDEFHWNQEMGFSDMDIDGKGWVPALADGSGVDALWGAYLTNPPVPYGHNGAETVLDFYNIAEGDNPCPASNANTGLDGVAFDDDLSSYDAAYMRLKSAVANDRHIAFSEDLTGADKTLAEDYTT